MQSALLLALLVALTAATALARAVRPVPYAITRTQITDDLGQFSLNYVNSDGLSVSDTGVLIPAPGGRDLVPVRRGSYRYVSPEGVLVSLSYIADHLGYRIVDSTVPGVIPTAV